jgi:hypothetical protein
MDDEAYLALEAIDRSTSGAPAGHSRWIKAFKAIRWVVQTEAGLILTPAGRQARDEMASKQAKQEGPANPAPTPRARTGAAN